MLRLLICLSTVFVLNTAGKIAHDPDGIELIFTDSVSGDYSFANFWSYQEGVYKNRWNQLDCDGLCPPEIDFLKDDSGRILPNKAREFYKIIDTTHHYHTLQCASTCNEFAGSDFIRVRKFDDKNWEATTLGNVATHCQLFFECKNNQLKISSRLISITPDGDATYKCTKGMVKISKSEWNRGFMKARFDCTLINQENPLEVITWSGLIYAPVKR